MKPKHKKGDIVQIGKAKGEIVFVNKKLGLYQVMYNAKSGEMVPFSAIDQPERREDGGVTC